MPELLPVLGGTLAAFVIGSVYYAATTSGDEPVVPWKLGVELLRCAILATVVAGLAVEAGIDDWAGGLALGLALWVGFPFVLWTGAMLWERTPLRMAVLHGGDWLVKLLALGVLLSVWQ